MLQKISSRQLGIIILALGIFALLANKFDLLKLPEREKWYTNLEMPEDEFGNSYAGINPVEETSDSLSWRVFAETQQTRITEETEDGFINMYYKPTFTENLLRRNGETIRVTGFMFPLEQKSRQGIFLFGPYPLSCPYHYHVPNSLVLMVEMENALPLTLQPIVLEGTLEIEFDAEQHLYYFYKMTNAKLVRKLNY